MDVYIFFLTIQRLTNGRCTMNTKELTSVYIFYLFCAPWHSSSRYQCPIPAAPLRIKSETLHEVSSAQKISPNISYLRVTTFLYVHILYIVHALWLSNNDIIFLYML